jgi:hypothetical protein
MSALLKVGLYGKGTTDLVKARADAKKAAEHAASNFSKTKPYNCIVHPRGQETKPKEADPKPQP